jgi:hypothetical protein
MKQRPFDPRVRNEPPMPNPSHIRWLSSLDAYKPSAKELTSHLYAKYSKKYWEGVSIRQYIYRKTLQKNIEDIPAKEEPIENLEDSRKRRKNILSLWDSSLYALNLNNVFRKSASPSSRKSCFQGPSVKDDAVLPVREIAVSIPCNCIPPYFKR